MILKSSFSIPPPPPFSSAPKIIFSMCELGTQNAGVLSFCQNLVRNGQLKTKKKRTIIPRTPPSTELLTYSAQKRQKAGIFTTEQYYNCSGMCINSNTSSEWSIQFMRRVHGTFYRKEVHVSN